MAYTCTFLMFIVTASQITHDNSFMYVVLMYHSTVNPRAKSRWHTLSMGI
jgi:hypothetical protein